MDNLFVDNCLLGGTYACSTCGRHPPEVMLGVCVGSTPPGEQGQVWLTCHECESGNASGVTVVQPDLLHAARVRDAEIKRQAKAYNEWLKNKRLALESEVAHHLRFWGQLFDCPDIENDPPQELAGALKQFKRRLVMEEIRDAMEEARSRYSATDNQEYVMKYFFGICWRKIKGDLRCT